MSLYPDPHWERGYRCHGYWVGEITRVGRVSIGPPPNAVARSGYQWSMDFPIFEYAKGDAKTLREAKRLVEKAFAAKRAEMRTRTYKVC